MPFVKPLYRTSLLRAQNNISPALLTVFSTLSVWCRTIVPFLVHRQRRLLGHLLPTHGLYGKAVFCDVAPSACLHFGDSKTVS